MSSWNDATILIPALNPPREVINYIKNLLEAGFHDIIVVNDGSRNDVQFIFDEIGNFPNCHLIQHALNLGKGRALKNGINAYLCSERYTKETSIGMICADSDGQHSVEDVILVAKAMLSSPDSLILGSRNFYDSSNNIPRKSLFGNRATTLVFKLLFGKKIMDTQTGLRGIPNSIMPSFIDLDGERFEYETNMLISTVKQSIPIIEIPIRTIYIDNNSETHFDPIRDSYKIYKLMFSVFFKYTIASLSSFLIDILLFQFFLLIFQQMDSSMRIALSTVLARACSSLYNYMVNKTYVFQQTGQKQHTLVKYYTLCIVQMGCSALLVSLLFQITHAPETVIKIIVDTCLFLLSFQIQQHWVFKNRVSKS